MENITEVVLRSVAVYVFMILAIRLLGKKELSQLNTTDLILILLISNSVQNAMVGADSSLVGGLAAASSLFLLNYLIKWLMYRYKKLNEVLEGSPVLLIYKGEVNEENLKKEKISISELEEAIREHGIEDFSQVALSMLESDGNISVVSGAVENQRIYRRKRGMSQKLRSNK